MPQYADLYELSEDDRINTIGRAAESGQRVAFIVEDDAKADRYINKLTTRFAVEIEKRLPGPVRDTISIIAVKRETIQ